MNKKSLISLLSALVAMCLAIFTLSACASTTVTISQQSASIIIGSTLELTATASDGSEIEWESSDSTIASVNKSGIVTGRKEGTVTITAYAGEASATCEVTVNAVQVTLSQSTATIERGETLELTATASDNGTITWSSSNEAVATVNNGVVTALKEGSATITAKRGAAGSATCTVTVVWNNKPQDFAEISFGEETVSAANPGNWYYWNDQNWVGSSVTVSNAEYANGTASFTYSGASSACWFGMQIFYKCPTNTVDKNYKVSFTVTSSSAGNITVNGTVVALVEGENQVEVFYTETANNTNGTPAASLSIQCGVSASNTVIEQATIAISNLTFTEYNPEKLSAPNSLTISSDKVATVGAVENARAYTLLFCQGEEVKYSVTLQSGDSFDDSIMQDGTYDIKVVAVGSGAYQSSEASAVLSTYTVSNGSVEYDLFAGGEVDAVANAGKYYFWTEFGGIVNGRYENGTISFDVTTGGNWYSNQIFFKNSALVNGTQYTLSFKINSTVAGNITVNGTVVALEVGDNTVSVTYTEGASAASISVQIGTYEEGSAIITAGSFIISDIVVTA
ncbi:MAG: hypothetical protein E7370_02450 [Clostridiales bacterium]|nr:hypothetical protein [Clostridiales bacterium]